MAPMNMVSAMGKRNAAKPIAVLIAAGGTGGHVFPALAIAERLRESQIKVVWIGTQQGIESRVVPENNFPLHTVSVTGMRGKRLGTMLLAPLLLIAAAISIIKLALQYRVVCMLGTGGYVSAASGIAAVVLRKPFFLQEQNAVAGTTNRLLAPFSQTIFTAYPGVFSQRANVDCCGNPLRQAFIDVPLPDARGVAGTKRLKILVVGGSLGASSLNAVVPAALLQWRETWTDVNCEFTDLQVFHQTGAHDHAQVEASYCREKFDAMVLPFIEDMAGTLQQVDLVIARAGALTISELTAVGVAAILVPYPHAIDDHQAVNAQWLVDGDAAVVIRQENFNTDSLIGALQSLAVSQNKLITMAKLSRNLARPKAAAHIAAVCEEYAHAC